MKITEITTPPAPPRVYWHVCPRTRVKQIIRQGITLGHKRNWRNPFGAQLGEQDRVYLFSEFDAAIEFAARLEWGLRRQREPRVDILEIETNLPVQPDPNIEAQFRPGTWWTSSSPIPASAIKRVIPLTLQMKREFIARRSGRTLEDNQPS